MTGFCGVGELEGGYAVLHHVWEGEEAPFAGDDGAELLDRGAFVLDVVDFVDGAVVVLVVGEVEAVVDLLPEGEEGFSYVGGGVVVERCCAAGMRN